MSNSKDFLGQGSGVNIGLLHDFLRKDILDRVSTSGLAPTKCVVLDPPLIHIVSQFVEKSALSAVGAEIIFPLNKQLPSSCPPNVVYFCRPHPQTMKLIANQIRDHIRAKTVKEYTLFFVPNKTVICDRALENEGVVGNFSHIGECNLFMIPLDSDLMTMELALAFREYQLLGDHTCIYHAANAIMQLQLIYGLIPRIIGKGDMAKVLADNLVRLRRELVTAPINPPEFESLIVIDRAVDLITPMCSQVTYEGLIDEVFGIHGNFVELPPQLAPQADQQSSTKSIKALLTSSDPVYAELRDMNFSNVGPFLARKTKSLSSEYEERHDVKKKTVSQIKQFTSKLKRMKDEQTSLQLHTNIATELLAIAKSKRFLDAFNLQQNFLCGNETDRNSDIIEDAMCQKEGVLNVLRLMCLQSSINSGLKPKVLENYWTEFRHTYGFQHILTLENLMKAGLLKPFDGKFSYSPVRQKFRLVVPDNEDGSAPDDISVTYSGYAPLSVRLIQCMTRPESGKALEETMKGVPGAFVDVQQLEGDKPVDTQGRQRVSLVFVLGGITYAEISAIRMLGRQEGRSFVVATTSLINGNTFIDTLSDGLEAAFLAPPPPPPEQPTGRK